MKITDVRLSPRRPLLVGLAAALALAAGCSSNVVQVNLHKNESASVSLQSRAQDGKAPSQGYAHPATLTEGEVGRILAAVGVEEHLFFAWRNRGPLFFSDRERGQLATWIADGLRKANADQWVRFSVLQPSKALLGTAAQFSDGICFVKDGKLNLVIGNIQFEPAHASTQTTEPYRLDPRDLFDIPDMLLSILAGAGPGAAPPPVTPGDKWLGKPRCNWLVFDLKTFLSAPIEGARPGATAAPAPATASPAQPPAGDPAERLKRLKDLRDQGLITAEEYDRKRQEIVQGL